MGFYGFVYMLLYMERHILVFLNLIKVAFKKSAVMSITAVKCKTNYCNSSVDMD